MTYQERFREKFQWLANRQDEILAFIDEMVAEERGGSVLTRDEVAAVERLKGKFEGKREERKELAAHVEGLRKTKRVRDRTPIGGGSSRYIMTGVHDEPVKNNYNQALDDLLAHLRQSDAPHVHSVDCGHCAHWQHTPGCKSCEGKAPQGDNKQ